jgi:deoxycytidylate deaminase
MSRITKFVALAQKIAEKSLHQFRIAAVIVQGNRILSIGINSYKTHPQQINPYTKKTGDSIHAELDALLSSRTDISGATIYVVRIKRNRSLGLARPCSRCQYLLSAAGIKKVVFTTDSGEILEETIT